MSSFKRLFPLLNRIVVRKAEQQTKTASGIIVSKPESASHGVVIESGPGAFDSNGKVIPMVVGVGDRVLLPEYGGQKVKINEQEFYIYRDTEIVGKLE
jgi:chaperonin GroES